MGYGGTSKENQDKLLSWTQEHFKLHIKQRREVTCVSKVEMVHG